MRYCKKCTMPDTRPGITFDSEGVCSACRHYENRKNVDWDARFKEFEAYCNKYRGMNGPGTCCRLRCCCFRRQGQPLPGLDAERSHAHEPHPVQRGG